jgi:hypothetical protein
VDDQYECDYDYQSQYSSDSSGEYSRHAYEDGATISSNTVSMQPLLALSRLQQLHIQTTGAAAECRALVQLSSLSCLTALGVSCRASANLALPHLPSAAVLATALGALPLKELELSGTRVSGAFFKQLGAFQGLTRLHMDSLTVAAPIRNQCAGMPYQGIDALQLAAVIQQLSALRSLTLTHFQCCSAASTDQRLRHAAIDLRGGRAFDSSAALIRAIGGLQDLVEVIVQIELPPELPGAGVHQLSGMLDQLLPSSLASHCEVRKRVNGPTLSICQPA